MDQKNWKAAHERYLEVMGRYLDLLDVPQANPRFALVVGFIPNLQKYIAGDRSDALYEEMTSAQ